MKRFNFILVCFTLVALSGCAHRIAFQDLHYSISEKKYDTGIIAVIDKNTLYSIVSIHSATTGIANRWDASPGEMLKQIADIEFPQMFNKYKQSDSYIVPSWEDETLFLVFTIPNYQFKNYHAYFTVKLMVYNKEKVKLMENIYKEEGVRQGGKMVWAGAFAMKSAVRVSSLDALKKIFNQIRQDLKILLEKKFYDDREEEYYSPQDQQELKKQTDGIDSFDDADEYYSPEE